MKFVLSINCNNDVFQPDALPEVAILLRQVAQRLDDGDSADYYRNITDSNGNIVGTFKLIKED